MNIVAPSKASPGARPWLTATLLLTLAVGSAVQAGPREQAKRIHDRLAGVPASDAVIDSMAAKISANDVIGAANEAMEHRAFYDVTLKNFVTPWTNRDANAFAPLNDYTATVIGMVRDNEDFRTVLYGDIIYTGSGSGVPAYSNTSNAHYEYLENNNINLKDALQKRVQSAVTGMPSAATAGVITTRAAGRAFFIDGTNRAMFRWTLMNHMCNDLEQVADTTYIPDRIRQDVTRSPGGDSRVFLNNCIGCHSGMDPLAGAYAYYDYTYPENDMEAGQVVYHDIGTINEVTGTRVDPKYHNNNANFRPGFITVDDSWANYWRKGNNQVLGWDSSLPGSGNGAKSMGMELAHSEAFAQCQVKKVFKAVCLRNAVDSTDRNQIDQMVSSFKANNYQLKRVFAESANYCKGE
ncbi:hypothetical protein [Permianibacter aggregans]|uniref:DUF1585 domain-containing protein n=1 Tax=Permianibacter aggregans TaxID=1510150 RepID=A0A4R6UTF9_9GAMM|nr:hypothetical protein [Permianibacter aggregans]QGX38660.1 hypothetical protein E2H98_02890 [Permianibacter aggregans]TDQ50451.1 hypothetical protein EV696_102132 [Permianibacter aggregans]